MWHPVIVCEKKSSSTEIPFQNVCPCCLFMVMANADIVGVCFVERKVFAFYWELSRFLEEFGNVAFHNHLLFFCSNPRPMYVLFQLSVAILEARFPILCASRNRGG
jgi:hypothetical protein